MQRQAVKAAAKAAPVVIGATAGAVASSSSSVAESQSLAVSAETLQESGILLKSQLLKSQDGTPWIIPSTPDAASDDEEVVDPSRAIEQVLALSQSLIQKKEVQDKIIECATEQGLLESGLLVSIESWPSPSESPTDSQILDNVSDCELERLREENSELRKENLELRAQVPAAEAAAGEEEEVPAEEVPAEPVLASLPTAQPLDSPALVKMSVDASGRVHVRCTGAADAALNAARGSGRPRKTSQPRKEKVRLRQAAIVATAIVVGVLAITITRNPKATKAAVTGAAAIVAGLFVAEQVAEQQVAAKRC